MTFITLCAYLGCILALVTINGQLNTDSQCRLQRLECGVCGLPVNVTLAVRNVLQPPTFDVFASVIVNHGVLLSILETVAEIRREFRFKVTYVPSIGYYIDMINFLEGSAENQTFWQVYSQEFGTLKCGISSYLPVDGETIIFNFTSYSDSKFTL